MSDPLYTVVPGKAYFAISLSDIPPQYILGGYCYCCGHRGPIDRVRVEKRWGRGYGYLRMIDCFLKCLACGSKHENRFTVIGTYLPEPLIAEVVELKVEKPLKAASG